MSEYVTCSTEFRDQELLIEALMEAGHWTRAQIEVHAEPQPLQGYRGDLRNQKAHIIIRKQYVGSASNDIGLERQSDGTYTSHISAFDQSKYGQTFQAKVKEEYGFRIIKRQQQAKGRRVVRSTAPNGRTRIVVEGFR